MQSATVKVWSPKRVIDRLGDVPSWVWWLLALAYVGTRTWFLDGVGVYGFYGDPDDATRLIQVRELMASWNWFDATTMKLGGDAGMLSHWSRLVDLPIALLIATFHLFMPIEDAEKLVHAVWPLSLLGALMWFLFRCVSQVAGVVAGRLSLLMSALTVLGWYQFSVGRIDHHNVMIAATVSAAALVWAFPERKDFWRIAGVLTGFALAVGYEALAPAVALGIFISAWAILDRRVERGAAAFAIALALTFAAAFFATIPPSRWMDIRCDAISLNMVALVGCGVAGLLVAVGPGRDWAISWRLASMAACGAVGLAIFGMLEPKCLAGPKGQLPPLLIEIWLNKVAENGSIVDWFLHRDFEQSFGLLAYYAIALAAQVHRLRQNRSAQEIFLTAMLVAMVGFACWQYKYTSYASFLGVIPLTIVFSALGPIGDISAATIKLGAFVLLNQTALIWASGGINAIAGAHKNNSQEVQEDASACMKPDAIRELAALPAGLFASHIDVGAFIAVGTHHRVLAAPYHRIGNAIIANYEIFSAHDAASAAAVLKQQNIDYVATCNGVDKPVVVKEPAWKGTLVAGLVDGKAPAYLVPVPLSGPGSLYHVWKVDRAALNLQLSKAAASKP